MKRVISIMLALTLICGTAVTASAATPADNTQKVLSLIKDRIGSTDQYDSFRSSSWTGDNGTVYQFNWEKDVDDSDDYASLYVTADEDGTIQQYSAYDSTVYNYDAKPSMSRPTQDAVLENAKVQVKKLNPDLYDGLVFTRSSDTELLDNGTYFYWIQRTESGIPVKGDTGYVEMSSDGTKLVDYSYNYTKGISFPGPEKAITKEAAQAAFAGEIGMKLRYERDYEQEEETVFLVYVPSADYYTYIDAFTGKPVTEYTDFGMYDAGGMGAAKESAAEDANERFSEAELAELEQMEGIMTPEEAEAAARACKLFNISSKATLAWISCSKNTDGKEQYRYSMSFVDNVDSEDGEDGAYVTLDAATGEFLYFSGYYYSDTIKKTKLTEAKAEAMAAEAAKTLAGEKFSQYRQEESQYGNVYFTRYINDIPYESDMISAYVDQNTGRLSDYSIYYSDVEFPAPDNVISKEEACKRLFDQVDYDLYYIPTKSSEKATKNDTVWLVYSLDDEVVCELDAFTGDLIKQYEADSVADYTDIAGHYGEKAITELARYGVGFTDEKYRPNDAITQAEFLQLMTAVFVDHSTVIINGKEDSKYVIQRAFNDNILKEGEEAPDSAVTRENAAVWMVRAMGLSEAADLDSIYRCPFNDVKTHVGYISILGGMKVFKGDQNGRFNPAKTLTRADAAIVLYNYLNR